MLVWLLALAAPLIAPAPQPADPGRAVFETRCARCHGADGNGGEMGPPIAMRLAGLQEAELTKLIREGIPPKGMPPNPVSSGEMGDLIKYLRTLQRRAEAAAIVRKSVRTTDGRTLDGEVAAEGFDDLQLR